jgi:hypothetical protein
MPLAFPSATHGTIAFGYFNIEIDMLLLEHYFFFGPSFCRAVVDLAHRARPEGEGGAEAPAGTTLPGFVIADRARAGNVNAAIQGWDLSGFIGATYQRFPFPATPDGFKQKPYGARNQAWAEETVREYGEAVEIPLVWDARAARASIGEIGFARDQLAALVAYVDRGGYPRWLNDERPPHVREMMDELRGSDAPLVRGLL